MQKVISPSCLPEPPVRPLYKVLALLADPKLSYDEYREIRRWDIPYGYWRSSCCNDLPTGSLVAFDNGFHPIYLKKPGALWAPVREAIGGPARTTRSFTGMTTKTANQFW
jgi:hypothetical protein